MFGIKRFAGRVLNRHLPRALILMYHHIRDQKPDPWDACVSPVNFQQHLEVLQDGYMVHLLSDLIKLDFGKQSKDRNIFITFDDGYLDNYELAVPQLNTFGFPATFFIPTQILQDGKYFWWEMLDYFFWQKDNLPKELYSIKEENNLGITFSEQIQNRNAEIEDSWSANTTAPPTARCRLYLKLCSLVKEKHPDEQRAFTCQMLKTAGKTISDYKGLEKMSSEQIRSLYQSGFEIGAHSVHHPALGLQDQYVQQYEIAKSKAQLEALTGREITTFAYPHGHYYEQAKSIVKKAGYTLACTTEYGAITNHTDFLELPRLWMKNYNTIEFKRLLEQYFNNQHF